MTEPDPLPVHASAPEPEPPGAPPADSPPAPAAPPHQRAVLPWLCAVGLLALAVAIGGVGWFSYTHQAQPPPDLTALQDRVAQLEQREQANGADAAGLASRVTAVEHRPVPDVAALQARIAALEQRPGPDLSALEARIGALEKRSTNNQQLAARLDTLAGRLEGLSGRDQSTASDLTRRLDADESRLAAVERAAADAAAGAQQAARLARIQAARAALAAGRPLGDLPGAPASVAQFAHAAPPIEAALRLAFPKAEQAALTASRPEVADKPFLTRVLSRAEDLVTIRQGDRVLVGDPAAGILDRARNALAAGDLAGAVAAVSSLSGPPAAAMAGWLGDAKALLAARAGLADMAAHG